MDDRVGDRAGARTTGRPARRWPTTSATEPAGNPVHPLGPREPGTSGSACSAAWA
ncbi:hypothetical protein ACFS5L_11670 [Streptomyces phyllanthi]|uniref:hypothetical protein n=1 Tax=Streptomyces phyllanthi TaxID=1803180 RepID=UPI003634A27C